MNNTTMIISMIGTSAAILFSLFAFTRNKKHDDADDGKQNGVLMTEIGYIKKGVDDIQRRLNEQENKYVEVAIRLAKTEAAVSSLHKRVDKIDGKD